MGAPTDAAAPAGRSAASSVDRRRPERGDAGGQVRVDARERRVVERAEGERRRRIDGVERLLHGRRAVRGGLDDHPPPVGGVGEAADEARLLEAVDQPGRGARRERRELADAADGHRALGREQPEHLDIGGGQAVALGDALGVRDAGGGEVGGGAEDRGDERVAVSRIRG